MKAKNVKIGDSEFYCTKCGKKGMPIARIIGRERESHHLKKLWCLYCQEEVNHAECRPWSKYTYEDFLLEFELGNFKDGERVVSYSEFRQKANAEGYI